MEHKTIKGVGGEVHYWISKANHRANEVIVFTHGLTADHTMYEKQIEFFQKEYNVIVWDVPLHGLSIPYRNFSYENTAKDLNSILQQEHIETVSLVGMSMGGYPSQMFAHLYPEKVKCFVGIDTTPFGTAYYSKSDLWWLSKVKPMAKMFPDKILRRSMAKSISLTDYSYNKMMKILSSKSKEQIKRHLCKTSQGFQHLILLIIYHVCSFSLTKFRRLSRILFVYTDKSPELCVALKIMTTWKFL